MPDHRSSSLSLAEPRQRSLLQDWVDRSLSDALSAAKGRGAPLLHVTTKKFRMAPPLKAFDSSVEDVFLFGGRDRVVLGIGVAKALEPSVSRRRGTLAKRILLEPETLSMANTSNIMVMGGWGFPPIDGPRRAGVWRDFPSSRWVVPALTLTSEGGDTRLALAVGVEPSSDMAPVRKLYRLLVKALDLRDTDEPEGPDAGAGNIPALERARGIPSRRSWVSLAQDAIDSISRDEMKKVVLSRAVALTFRGNVPASLVLRRLIALNPDSTVFAVKMKGSVFLGASPESLMSVKKGDVEVDCLAASSPRSKDRATDERLGARLLADQKSRREHQFVVQAAVNALSPMSSSVKFPPEPVLKRLATIQHLYTPVKAKLLDGDAWEAALALWPNPAMGGEPKEKAVSWIRRSERLDRGWYSGVVGLMDIGLDEADLVVAIRSGVIKGRRAVIYAGAGLVEGSEPQQEFEETGWKLGTMGRALGIDDGVVAEGGR